MSFLRMRTIVPRLSLLWLVLAIVDCGDKARCDKLRDDTYEMRRTYAQCETDEDCYPLPGNPKDCTGVLSCPFAVNRRYREDAERLMLRMGDDSVDCHLCAIPNCNSSSLPHCEPISHQCLMITLVDAGSTFGPPPNAPDGGNIEPPPDDDAGTSGDGPSPAR